MITNNLQWVKPQNTEYQQYRVKYNKLKYNTMEKSLHFSGLHRALRNFLALSLMLLTFVALPIDGWGQTTETYGWETSDDATKWTITSDIDATSGQGNTGTYAGKINTNHTYVQ